MSSRASRACRRSRARQLHARAPRGVRSRVPRDADPGRRAELRREPSSLVAGRRSAGSHDGDRRRPSRTEQRPGETLRAAAVSRHFEGVHALDDVTLELHRHEVVGLIGPNGAGKTTLVNVVTGFDRPSTGRPSSSTTSTSRPGLPTAVHAPAWHVRSSTGTCSRGLSVRENVEVSALGVGCGATGGPSARGRAAGDAGLDGLRRRTGGGAAARRRAQARCGACAGHGSARFVLMDEPAAGLHEGEVAEFAEVVAASATNAAPACCSSTTTSR